MSKPVVIYYEKDIAGRNIAGILEDEFSGIWIEKSKREILYMDSWEFEIPSICIIPHCHKSKSNIPSLTVHSPGNFGVAESGGTSRELGIAPAYYLREALIYLESEKRDMNLEYEVSFEVTHHGPTKFEFPMLFVEVGSSKRQWNDIKACRAIANTIYRLIKFNPSKIPVAIGFGGGHYCRKFSRIRDYALGHICPKYNLHNIDMEMIQKMILRTFPRPGFAIVEKKGMGGEKNRILNLLNDVELDVVFI
ncbi:MAG: hypothetical protein DRO94_00015 [Candidatus Altiarchaeales archaeon]|nr:MAG: hypothetical protein DRO95_03490 [Candidatus Altiarchaeales archaeon]RLI95600.1 MAG: hypothetical protein DRO94_00015 [Candidatus Altiarchaeales archaeon]HDO82740.1 hypothetical protein [Candidatus Altiarchaeales archaeon]HEX55389.1 hypothetical protein [Candidatus Altiarchaeales archaeon]